MFGQRVRELRQARGLTQAELATRSGVSRQLVGAVETGRHLPRVDAALALAAALGVSVEALADPPAGTVEAVLGALPDAGTSVRAGRVGDRVVCVPTAASFDGWGVADGVMTARGLELLDDARPGAVALGCDPALGLAARLVTARSPESVLAVTASTADAVAALAGGRAHACVVHGVEDGLPAVEVDVARFHLSRWQVGLAAPDDAAHDWVRRAVTGQSRVIQRRPGAGSQAAFERAVRAEGDAVPDGPLVEGHLEAAWLASRLGLPAVTIEPAALAAGLVFHPFETHVAQLWIDRAWLEEPGVRRIGEVMTSPGFARRLAAVGGYDLAGAGAAVVASS
jgi:transcriptional regulator with XRE-family HTH domain